MLDRLGLSRIHQPMSDYRADSSAYGFSGLSQGYFEDRGQAGNTLTGEKHTLFRQV